MYVHVCEREGGGRKGGRERERERETGINAPEIAWMEH